eukprot:CAMPEP_0114654058 /NCGR_PEP_ID=MMETSP0191-20121206/10220_1 /TAXON_ID=126664 /ORGANISM="Sorites sp." /LENGTH=41 /DNA_ID= /DNA_START= /DNA_END= /DNA_ORIENTATION=
MPHVTQHRAQESAHRRSLHASEDGIFGVQLHQVQAIAAEKV